MQYNVLLMNVRVIAEFLIQTKIYWGKWIRQLQHKH